MNRGSVNRAQTSSQGFPRFMLGLYLQGLVFQARRATIPENSESAKSTPFSTTHSEGLTGCLRFGDHPRCQFSIYGSSALREIASFRTQSPSAAYMGKRTPSASPERPTSRFAPARTCCSGERVCVSQYLAGQPARGGVVTVQWLSVALSPNRTVLIQRMHEYRIILVQSCQHAAIECDFHRLGG
jgi:hypothetical protein